MSEGLKVVLELLIAGGVGGIVYVLMNLKFELWGWKVDVQKSLKPDEKRFVSLALGMALPVLAFLAALGLGYHALPVGFTAWCEKLFSLMTAAILSSQGLHGYRDLRK